MPSIVLGAMDDPKGVTVTNNKVEREGEVFIDWQRNTAHASDGSECDGSCVGVG
jgi:DNA primase